MPNDPEPLTDGFVSWSDAARDRSVAYFLGAIRIVLLLPISVARVLVNRRSHSGVDR